MRPLSIYIEYLLMTRHYAFVPGLGGFMFQEISAHLDKNGTFTPPFRLIKFNRFMDHDDGMLANVIMQCESISYDKVVQSIRISVNDILNKVQHNERYQLGRLGYVFCDEDCHISFRGAGQMENDPVHFGLSQVKMQRWQDVAASRGINVEATPVNAAEQSAETIKTSEKKEKTTKPRLKHHDGIVELPTRWLRRAAIVLLVVSFIIANMIPWSTTHNGMHFANLVDTGSLLRHLNILDPAPHSDLVSAETISADSTHSALANEVSADSTTVQSASSTIAEAPSVVASTDEQPASVEVKVSKNIVTPPQKSISSISHKQYYVIVGSCATVEEANQYVRRLQKRGIEGLDILEKDGRYRIYIDHFDRKQEAVSYLDQLRATTSFKDAWLLAVRPSAHPISYNKKIKDNDQLPMELSHFNRTTERDQG